jgi:hypothetical protein
VFHHVAGMLQVFYIESPDIAKMTEQEVAAVYASMGGAKVRGRGAPKPIRNWAQCGLPVSIMQTLKRHNFREPLPVQVCFALLDNKMQQKRIRTNRIKCGLYLTLIN